MLEGVSGLKNFIITKVILISRGFYFGFRRLVNLIS